jgi:predicted ATPase
LIELVPILERLFPVDEYPHQKVIEVSPSEAEERTFRLFERFLSCVSHEDRPLVLFIDDFQWCSSSEASVLSSLIGTFDPRGLADTVRNCLMIITYRVNEISDSILNPLNESLDKLKRQGDSSCVVRLEVGALHLVRNILISLTNRTIWKT